MKKMISLFSDIYLKYTIYNMWKRDPRRVTK